MAAATRRAAAAVGEGRALPLPAAIATTDRFFKQCALDVELSTGTVRLGGCAKGAGMIAPAMATMLSVVTTDALLPPEEAQDLLLSAVGESFKPESVWTAR